MRRAHSSRSWVRFCRKCATSSCRSVEVNSETAGLPARWTPTPFIKDLLPDPIAVPGQELHELARKPVLFKTSITRVDVSPQSRTGRQVITGDRWGEIPEVSAAG